MSCYESCLVMSHGLLSVMCCCDVMSREYESCVVMSHVVL